jgi:arylsulfatase
MKEIASHYGGTTDPLVVSWPARIKDHGGLRHQFGHVNDIGATILDVAGIPFPEEIDGVKQIPFDGTSLAYSFDHADAPSQHRLQIFEQYGNRAIYQDGWVAAARHALPWFSPRSDDFDHDRWELYHVDADFSEAHDLAQSDPQRLDRMKALFDEQAKDNHIYPMQNPPGWGGKKSAPKPRTGSIVYYPGLARLNAMHFGQSHRLTAEAVMPAGGAEGVLVQNGSRFGGFVLYVRDHHLVYENVTPNRHRVVITSKGTVPDGKVTLAFDFEMAADGRGGTGRLYINGQVQGEAHLPHFGEIGFGAFTVGRGLVSPVSEQFALPYTFTGQLQQVELAWK